MKKEPIEKVGLLVILETKSDKGLELSKLLKDGEVMIKKEKDTLAWFAFQMDDSSYGIFDTFQTDLCRMKHLNGDVALTLMANSTDLLDDFQPLESINGLEVLASAKTHASPENVGLIVLFDAKKGKEKKVRSFLKNALPLVQAEKETISWYAVELGNGKFGIFDTFCNEKGRQAHLRGKVTEALLNNAEEILEGFDVNDIKAIDILACK